MHPFEVEAALNSLTILVDTREQPTKQFEERIAAMGVPVVRHVLNFGDYSAKVTLPNGEKFSLENSVCVERKMDIDELCSCFSSGRNKKSSGRERFTREFERAKAAGAKLYLLIEGATWENIYRGHYQSMMNPHALEASINTWQARYNCPLLFCTPNTSGRLIKDVLYREMKERLDKHELT